MHVPKKGENIVLKNTVYSVNRKLQAFLKDENDEHDTTSTGKVFHRRVE